ncbi:MAG TPA: hypothetical protein VGJ28_04740 [Micromonosporaceae bacterium]
MDSASRFRAFLAGTVSGWELLGVTAVAVVLWRLTLGWDWATVISAGPTGLTHTSAPQSDLDWLMLALGVTICVGWLAWRGSPVVGALLIWVPLIVLSGWRLAAAGTAGWLINLASLVFVLSAVCIVAGSVGAWLRHRSQDPVEFEDEPEPVEAEETLPVEPLHR